MFIFYAAIVSATVLSTIDGIFCLSCGPVMICHYKLFSDHANKLDCTTTQYKMTESS